MKLMLVTPYFYPKIGGLENYAYKFALGLKTKFKWDITVVTTNHNIKKDTYEEIHGFKIYRLATLFTFSNTPISPFWFWKIKKIIKKEMPDIINAHTPVPGIADVMALATPNKTPFIVTYHAFKLHKYNFTPLNLLISIYQKFELLLFERANKIIIVSDVIKESIPIQFHDRVLTIYNSLQKKEIPQIKITIKKELNIIFIGSLNKSHNWKGLKETLLAIKQYKDIYDKKIIFSIIGDGDNLNYYKDLVKDYKITQNVNFLGKKDGADKTKLLKNAAIAIIYPISSNDAFPTVALEYWAHSIPIIAADVAPINKIFKHKENAYLVKSNTPTELAKAIDVLVKDKSLAQLISSQGYKELTSKYLLDNELNKLNSLLKGLKR